MRVEFFGDEIDAMGYFDPVTQRRVENADELVLLPVAETLPPLHPGGHRGAGARSWTACWPRGSAAAKRRTRRCMQNAAG